MTQSQEKLRYRYGWWSQRHGLRVSLGKTEVMWVGQRRKELEILLDGEKLKQTDSFVYLGGAIFEDGKSDPEIRRRITAGAKAWR